jgi:6-phosphogluconate dehydrogenase
MNENEKSSIGVIGLSVMGSNLAMNIADHNWVTSIYNRSRGRTEELVSEYGKEKMRPQFSLEEFVASLSIPRKILLMVKDGAPVDEVISQLKPLVSKGDIIIDGGNSFFKETIRREEELKKDGILFVGMGVSGGEEGARKGPAIMPGGSNDAWENIKPIMESIAAKDFKGNACVSHIGENGAGHYVKMVHNGIEYIDMQLIAEIYWIMKNALKMDNEKIASQFETWNKGRLDSFLIEITSKVLRAKYANGSFVIDSILDSAGSKGTGKWTSEEILELGTPGFGMVSAVLARYASAHKEDRILFSKEYQKNNKQNAKIEISELENALYVSKILAYAQGYDLIREAAKAYGWNLNLKEISRIWEGGCIIRARFLAELEKAFAENPKLKSILISPVFKESVKDGINDVRKVVSVAINLGLPIPAMLSGVSYFDSMTSEIVPANMIQAQRDYFGAHTFQKEIGGEFIHHNWS